jgi:uncharacterized protein related to proFAR isomerase
VVRGLLSLHPFRVLYVADLDAIQHRRVQHEALIALQHAFPQLDVWFDCGVRSVVDYAAAIRVARPVLGSETLAARSVRAILARAAAESTRPPALSIDVRDDTVLGAAQLLAAATAWPARVIAMSLSRVGTAAGPDLALIARLRSLAPRAQLFASGGVRNLADLLAARDAGCAGALVATSLHDGALCAADLAQVATWNERGD